MENASKALIIAGSIFIAIALIGVSIYLYTSVTDNSTGAIRNIDSKKVQALNGELELYEGNSVTDIDTKNLIKKINILNTEDYFPQKINLISNNPTQIIINGNVDEGFEIVTTTNFPRYSIEFEYLGISETISTVIIGLPN